MTVQERIDREVKKKEKKKTGIHSWYRRNEYKIWRVVLFPIYLSLLAREKWRNYRRKHCTENAEKTKKYLDIAFPKLISQCAEDPYCFLVNLNYLDDYGDFSKLDFYKSYYVGKHISNYFSQDIFCGKMDEILLDYEISGYTKVVLDNWIKWRHAEKAFGWGENYNADYQKSILFYSKEKYGEVEI